MVGGTAGDMQWHSPGDMVVACLIIVSLQVLSFENLTLNFELLSSDLDLDHGLDTGP